MRLVDVSSLISLRDAARLDVPVVYAICRSDGAVVYVGKTTRPSQRFSTYEKTTRVHNEQLKQFLQAGRALVSILSFAPPDLSTCEAMWISEFAAQISNRHLCPAQTFNIGCSKPWSAGTGRPTPAGHYMRLLKPFNPVAHAKLRRMMSRMSDARRCTFEIGVYLDMPPEIQPMFESWRSATVSRMHDCMVLEHGDVKAC